MQNLEWHTEKKQNIKQRETKCSNATEVENVFLWTDVYHVSGERPKKQALNISTLNGSRWPVATKVELW